VSSVSFVVHKKEKKNYKISLISLYISLFFLLFSPCPLCPLWFIKKRKKKLQNLSYLSLYLFVFSSLFSVSSVSFVVHKKEKKNQKKSLFLLLSVSFVVHKKERKNQNNSLFSLSILPFSLCPLCPLWFIKILPPKNRDSRHIPHNHYIIKSIAFPKKN